MSFIYSQQSTDIKYDLLGNNLVTQSILISHTLVAKIFPYPITHYKTPSEKQVVETFAESLSNRYTLFYDRRWNQRGK